MLVGNAILLILALTIFMSPSWTVSVKDGVYFVVVVLAIVLRYVDITRYGGRTTYGEPATRRDFVRYGIGMTVFSIVLWAIAQSVQIV